MFILTTDATKVAVAAILSQVQKGLEHPVAYGSRLLNKPAQAYSASQAKLLTLVWASKHFRCYLYGRRFTVRTDHAGLAYKHFRTNMLENIFGHKPETHALVPETVGTRFQG
jgi:hypothetical protein